MANSSTKYIVRKGPSMGQILTSLRTIPGVIEVSERDIRHENQMMRSVRVTMECNNVEAFPVRVHDQTVGNIILEYIP